MPLLSVLPKVAKIIIFKTSQIVSFICSNHPVAPYSHTELRPKSLKLAGPHSLSCLISYRFLFLIRFQALGPSLQKHQVYSCLRYMHSSLLNILQIHSAVTDQGLTQLSTDQHPMPPLPYIGLEHLPRSNFTKHLFIESPVCRTVSVSY